MCQAQLSFISLLDRSASGRKTHAARHHGVQSTRILPFPRTHVIPCFLHCLSAIVRKLFKLLIRDTSLSEKIARRWEEILATRKVKLVIRTEERKTFEDRVKNSRWGRPEWLAILQYHHELIDVMQAYAGYIGLINRRQPQLTCFYK